jgi:hypothetical protein
MTLPTRVPDGLRNTVRARVERNPLWDWSTVEVSPEAPDPVSLLSRYFAASDSAQVHDTRSLARSRELSGKVIWIEGLTSESWGRWKDFIHNYCQICKDMDLLERGLFVLNCKGPVADDPPASDVALGVHAFRGMVGNLDMSLWLARALDGTTHSPQERQIRISVAAELAGNDPGIGLDLAGLDLETLFEPYDLLTSRAAALSLVPGAPPSWTEGMVDEVDGVHYPHPLFLAALGAPGRPVIRQRVWSGQLRVLFPWLERERIALLEEVGPLLRLPFDTGFGEVTDKHDLELGHIFFQVKNRVDRELRRWIGTLMDIRNALAHLEPVRVNLVRDLMATMTKRRSGL